MRLNRGAALRVGDSLRAVRFIIDGSLEQPTGGYIYDKLVIAGLRDRGHPVEVVSLARAGWPGPAGENIRFARQLRREGIVIADELCHPRVFAGAWTTRVRPAGPFSIAPRRVARLVTLVHHLTASEHRGVRRRLRLAIERPLLLASDRIIVTSDTTRASVIEVGADPARVRVVKPGRDRLGVRTASPVRGPHEPLRLLFAGSLTPRKDPLVLLRAFAAVRDRARLTLAGPADRDPRYAAEVLSAASRHGSRVRITGQLRDDDLAAELDRHDVLVLPSRYEGFGMAVVEALSHGLAVVATRAGALPEILRDGEEARLVFPGDDRALAAVLSELAGDRGQVEAMKARALLRAAELPVWADTQSAFAEQLVF